MMKTNRTDCRSQLPWNFVLFLGVLILAASPSFAGSLLDANARGYDFTGPYFQFGGSAGALDLDKELGQKNPGFDLENESAGGFTITGGFRATPWLSGEANLSWLGGGEIEDKQPRGSNRIDTRSSAYAFTFGPKVYPLGLIDNAPAPMFQPYALVGLGGGEFNIDTRRRFGKNVQRSSFVARFLFGFDVWVTDNIGLYTEGGYHVWDDDAIDGVGVWSIGGQFRM